MKEGIENSNGDDTIWKIDAILKIITLVLFLCSIVIMIIVMDYHDTAKDTVIYRVSQDKVMFEFTFWDWSRARGYHPDYQQLIIPREHEIVDIVANVGFKARFKYVGGEDMVKSYLKEGDDPRQELNWAAERCVLSVIRWATVVRYHPDVEARSISVSDMKMHCPFERYGYEWVGTLEIVQCYPYPDDHAMKNKCLMAVQSVPPYD